MKNFVHVGAWHTLHVMNNTIKTKGNIALIEMDFQNRVYGLKCKMCMYKFTWTESVTAQGYSSISSFKTRCA